MVVRGKLEGKLKANGRLELHNGASVVGEIVAPRISIEDGAQLQGRIDMPQLARANQPQVEVDAPSAVPEQRDPSETSQAEPSAALVAS